jgi:hypothetical protein
MTETASHTPVIGAWSTKRRNSILKTAQTGTPFRTPDRRRFGPLGMT